MAEEDAEHPLSPGDEGSQVQGLNSDRLTSHDSPSCESQDGATPEEQDQGENFLNQMTECEFPGLTWRQPDGARKKRREINEEKIQRILEENHELSFSLTDTNEKLWKMQREHDELEVRWKASTNLAERQKLVTQSLLKNIQHADRTALQNSVESAQTINELEDVQRRLQVVNRQLRFAIDMQKQASEESGRRLSARARKIRKLELAMFAIVAQAQCDPRTRDCVTELVAKAGPLIQSVLSREAKRQALDLTNQESHSSPTSPKSDKLNFSRQNSGQ